MDDTLIQTRLAKYAAHKHAAKKFYNLVLTDEDIDKHWGKPFEEMVAGIYGNIDKLENILNNYYTITSDFPIPPYPETHAVVAELCRRLPLGIVTAANRRLTHAALEEAGVDQGSFLYIQTADDTEVHKPDPRVFDPICRYFSDRGIVRNELLYIGDALTDFQAAGMAGIQFLAIAGHTTAKDVFRAAGGRAIDNLQEIHTYLMLQ